MNHQFSLAVLGAMCAVLSPSPTFAQEQGREEAEAKHAEAKIAMHDLVSRAKVTLPQAIETALQARPGVACVAELEATGNGADAPVIFEVMIVASDQKVYEVQVDAADRRVRSNEECTDEEDVGEIHALAGKIGKKVTLLGVANAARSVLRGTCVRAEFVAKGERATVIMSKDALELEATFSLGSGALQGISLKRGPTAHTDSEGEEEEGEEAEERGEKVKKAKAGKNKRQTTEAEEEEEEEEEHKPAPKTPGKKKE